MTAPARRRQIRLVEPRPGPEAVAREDRVEVVCNVVFRFAIGVVILTAISWFGAFAAYVLDPVTVSAIGWTLLGLAVAMEVDVRVVRGR